MKNLEDLRPARAFLQGVSDVDRKTGLEGRLRMEGFASDVPIEGELLVDPLLGKRIRYQFRFTGDDGKRYQVGEYVISNGSARQFVIYWYEAHGRSVASEYWAKYYLVKDAIRMNRTDGSLVRVITPVTTGESLSDAKSRGREFTAHMVPSLHRVIPD